MLYVWLFGSLAKHNALVDVVIGISVAVVSFVTWFSYRDKKQTDVHLTKLMQDMAALQSAEEALAKIQTECGSLFCYF